MKDVEQLNEAYNQLHSTIMDFLWEVGGVNYDDDGYSNLSTDADTLIRIIVDAGWSLHKENIIVGNNHG